MRTEKLRRKTGFGSRAVGLLAALLAVMPTVTAHAADTPPVADKRVRAEESPGERIICNAAQTALRAGDPAPPLAMGSWAQGEPITKLESTKAYLIEFWATWCGPCVTEVPHLNELHLKFKDKGLVVIGQAVSKQDQDRVKPFISKMGGKMTYRVALDDFSKSERGAMAANWYDAAGLKTIPSAMLVGKDGRIAWIGDPRDLRKSIIEETLAGTLDPAKAKAESQKQRETAPAAAAAMAFMQCVTEKKWDEADKALARLYKIPDALPIGMQPVFRLMILVGKGDYDSVDALLGEERFSDDALNAVNGIHSVANREARGKNERILSVLARVALLKGRDAKPGTRSTVPPAGDAGKRVRAQESRGERSETLPPLKDGQAPRTFEELWGGFDPKAEPLEVQVLKEWEQEGVVLRVVRYRIGIFKGQKAMMAGVYGFPKGGAKLPGLLQIHGGGQYADYRAVLTNAQRGYATLSIAWAGRISAPGYGVGAEEVKLFWAGKTENPKYKLTTDWGPLDAYHAPMRYGKNEFAATEPAPWTLDTVRSPRNNPWFLCALGARRGLTFLQQQPEVDPEKLGVYGHSMGGKITVMVAGSDPRVKAAVPSCGGVSYRRDPAANDPIDLLANADAPYLTRITCPILFLSPSNDFHGQIDHLQKALTEIKTDQWRVVCSPHHNHQDTPEYMVGGPLWFDQHLKGSYQIPRTPEIALELKTSTGVPSVSVTPDSSRPVLAVDFFYTQQGLKDGTHDFNNTMCRFWHYAPARSEGKGWAAELPLATLNQPLWVYANFRYALEKPVTAAGYYYDVYSAKDFVLSSRMLIASAGDLQAAGNKATLKPTPVIEAFGKEWRKEWFSYNLKGEFWPCCTHKLYDPQYTAPAFAKLALKVRCEQANRLVVKVDGFSTGVSLKGAAAWQHVELFPVDFHDSKGVSILHWRGLKELSLGGSPWHGSAPEFANLRWVEGTKAELNARREVKLAKAAPEGGHTYLDVAHADSFTCGYDFGLKGKPLQVGQKSYAHVIRAHAPSEAVFFLGGKYRRFHAMAWRGPQATVTFEVHTDGKMVFDSGAGSKVNPAEIDLPMEGVQELKLVVTDGGNGKSGDHAAWLDASLAAGAPGKEPEPANGLTTGKHDSGALDFTKLIPATLPRSAVYRQEGWCLWDPCIIRSDDGKYHLFYSRWPKSLGFDAWCTHAEIAWATAKKPEGPYEFRGVVLFARGGEFWDAHSVFNTCVIRHGEKYYLYYTGNRGSAAWRSDRSVKASSDEWWTQRNNQRIGVAVADHPGGPWRRFDKPLIDVGPEFGQGIINVPNALTLPDGSVRLYYKTLAPGPGKFGGGVFHFAATAADPLGPFHRHPRPMVDKQVLLKTDRHFNFHIDDHCEWIQEGRYYAIVKDHEAPFLTPHGRSLLLFESPDGLDWHPSPHALVKDFHITWDDGAKEVFQRLEAPKLLIEKGTPTILSLAAQPSGSEDSFLVLIPLNKRPVSVAEEMHP